MAEAHMNRPDYRKQGHILVIKDNKIIADSGVILIKNPGKKGGLAQLGISINPEYISNDLYNYLLKKGIAYSKRNGMQSVTMMGILGNRKKEIKLIKEGGFYEDNKIFQLSLMIDAKCSDVKLLKGYNFRTFNYPNDVSEFVNMMNHAIDDGPNPPNVTPALVNGFFSHGLIKASDFFIVEREGRMVAGGIASLEKAGDAVEGLIHNLSALKDEHRSRIERALLSAVLNYFSQNDVKVARLWAGSYLHTLKMYKAAGFKIDTTTIKFKLDFY
jgi:hypothetical protein